MITSAVCALLLGFPAQQAAPPVTAAPVLPVYQGPRKRAVVTAMEVKVQGVATSVPTPSGTTTVVTLDIEQPTEFGTGLSDMLTTALVESNRFVVLERQNVEEVVREQELSRGEGFNPATAVAAGQMLGAQVLVRGSVTELSFRRSGSGIGGILGDAVEFRQAKAVAMVALDIKVVDVATGVVIDSIRAEGKAGSSSTALTIKSGDIQFGNVAFDNSPIGRAVRDAIQDAVLKICRRTDSIPWQARVARVVVEPSGASSLYLTAGTDSGIKVGDQLEVFTLGEEIVDPETMVVLGRTDGVSLGLCRVIRVEQRFSVAEYAGGGDQAQLQIVKFPRTRA